MVDRAALEIGLHAAVIAVEGGSPLYLTVPGKSPAGVELDGLPFGPYRPQQHRTLDTGLRSWVEDQTRLSLGYVEQLYTFGDMGRMQNAADQSQSFVSVGYLALVRKPDGTAANQSLKWGDWYGHFPWEDWRSGPPPLLTEQLMPALAEWVAASPGERSSVSGLDRQVRFRLAFGCELRKSDNPEIIAWDEERVLERYELMYEAGLVDEAVTDGQVAQLTIPASPGRPMLHDHRRILATAIARLRAKLKYRPVVFELLPEFPEVRAWISFSCRDDEHVAHGESFAECAALAALQEQIVAVGVNCLPPEHVTPLLISATDCGLPLVVYPNSGEHWDAEAQQWRGQVCGDMEVGAWHRHGARLIGGCCRTVSDDIRAMRSRLQAALR